MYICARVYMYICIYVSRYICKCVCVFMCVCVYVYVCVAEREGEREREIALFGLKALDALGI